MKMKGLYGLCAVVMMYGLSSCQKPDQAVALPTKSDAQFSNVEMGEDYKNQIFFDFQTNRIVHISEINSWDLAFEASSDGFHIFMNGGADVFVYNTHKTDLAEVKEAPEMTSKEWMFDRPCGLDDSTAIGDWRGKNEVFIVRLNSNAEPNNLRKIRFLAVTTDKYVVEYANLDEDIPHTLTIPKDDKYHFSYISLAAGGQIVQPDPPKDTWDIVFTRYRIIYYDMDNFPYIVTGVLLNPDKTKAYAPDSTAGIHQTFSGPEVLSLPYSPDRDVIGYNWKKYNFDNQHYEVDRDRYYMVLNRRGQYWKLHFLDFYNKQGVKGSPSFEFVRMY